MVVAQLRTAVGVREREYAVEAFGAVLFFKGIGNEFGLAVYAADCGNNPQLVAYAHVAVCPLIHVYLAGNGRLYGAIDLVIGILEVLREVGVRVVRVHMAARGDIGGGIGYIGAVFDYLFTLFYVAQGELMALGYVLLKGHAFVRLPGL